jgi:hypothetical protein
VGDQSRIIWYYSKPENKLVAYDKVSRRRVREAGSMGFGEPGAADIVPFTERLVSSDSSLLQFRHSVYLVDLTKETMLPLTRPPENGGTYEGSGSMVDYSKRASDSLRVFYLLRNALHVTDSHGKILDVRPLPKLDKNQVPAFFHWNYELNRYYVDLQIPWHRYHIDSDGGKSHVWEVDLNTGKDRVVTLASTKASQPAPHWTKKLSVILTQPWQTYLEFTSKKVSVLWKNTDLQNHSDSSPGDRKGWTKALAIQLLVGVFCAGIAWVRLRHCQAHKNRHVWVSPAFAFLGGIAGLLAVWVWNEPREGAETQPLPGKDGTEIFTLT